MKASNWLLGSGRCTMYAVQPEVKAFRTVESVCFTIMRDDGKHMTMVLEPSEAEAMGKALLAGAKQVRRKR